MANVAEGVMQTAEMPRAYQPEQWLHDSLTSCYDNLPEQKQQFVATVDKVLLEAVDPTKTDAIMVMAGIYDWQFFGQPEDELPVGLVKYRLQSGETHVTYDPRVMSATAADSLSKMFKRNGLEDLVRLRSAQRDKHIGEIVQTLQRSIQESPTYQRLSAIADQALLKSEPVDSPLSESDYWRRMREIDHGIRHTNGLGRDEPVGRLSEIDREQDLKVLSEEDRAEEMELIGRRLEAGRLIASAQSRLDIETVRRPQLQPRQEDGLARAKDYFQTLAQRYWDRTQATRLGPSVIEWNEVNEIFVAPTPNLTLNIRFEDIAGELTGRYLTADNYSVKTPEDRFAEGVVRTVLRQIPSPKFPDLHSVMAVAAGNIISGARFLFDNSADELTWEYSSIAYLLQTQGMALTQNEKTNLDRKHWAHERFQAIPSAPGIDFVDRESAAEALRTVVGRITPDSRILESDVTRLVMSQGSWHELPIVANHQGLRLELSGANFHGIGRPYIPSYELIGKTSTGEFCFEPTEGDAYAPCLERLPEEGKQRLIGEFESLGLHNVATTIRKNSDMTVEDLRAILEFYTEYHMTSRDDGGDYRLSIDRPDGITIKDFVRFVENGRLGLQCTGSAHLLRVSLDIAFGEPCAGVISGYPFSASETTLRGLKHAQTIFKRGGYVYILDATAADHRSRLYEQEALSTTRSKGRVGSILAAVGLGREARQHAAKRQSSASPALAYTPSYDQVAKQIVEDLTLASMDDPTLEATKRRHNVEAASALLLDQLCLRFGAKSTDRLFKQFMVLSTDDPIRRTLKVALRASDSGRVTDVPALHEARDYLDTYLLSDKTVRSRYGIGSYDAGVIRDMKNALDALAATV